MSAVELGTGYVSVVPSTKGIAASLAGQMNGPMNAAGKAAERNLGGLSRKIGMVGGALSAIGVTTLSGLPVTKDRAARIDLSYFKRPHLFRSWRFWLSVALPVAGLLWIGIMLPELQDASEWREFGLRELLNEVDKQILPDGADSESSNGYHRLKLELLLYSFVLCRGNEIEIDQKYWQKLRAMADYTRAYLRPDECAPLIGDSDSGQVMPIVKRAGNDHAYLLCLAAAALSELCGEKRLGCGSAPR